MVGPVSQTYSELQRLQIHKFATVLTQNLSNVKGQKDKGYNCRQGLGFLAGGQASWVPN